MPGNPRNATTEAVTPLIGTNKPVITVNEFNKNNSSAPTINRTPTCPINLSGFTDAPTNNKITTTAPNNINKSQGSNTITPVNSSSFPYYMKKRYK